MVKDKSDRKLGYVRYNEQIRIPQVLVIKEGQNLGVMQTREALNLARSVGLDLVEVAANERPPVCQIMEYGKFMYAKSKKDKVKPPASREKEICFRYVTDENDLQTKANQAKKFLEKGNKVRLVVKLKAREKAHKDCGLDALKRMIEILSDVAVVEKEPAVEGNNITARLDLKKENKK